MMTLYISKTTKKSIMKNKTITAFIILCLISFSSCSQNKEKEEAAPEQKSEPKKAAQHRYGGWYCPDNLNGFPAVDIAQWKNVAVVNGRMPTKEETQNGTSLIHVDTKQYPHAKPLDITMPKLAHYYNKSSRRKEIIVVIQAVNINNDSIVGFRYLNGGNGSAHLSEITFISEKEIEMNPRARFVSLDVKINATQDKIWETLTKAENAEVLEETIDAKNELKKEWRKQSNINFHYAHAGNLSAGYADKLFGCFYIQNDYKELNYTEKFLLLENDQTKNTILKISCGPYVDDYEEQKRILTNWAQKVKFLSEKK